MSDQPQDDKKQPVYKASGFRFGHIDAEGRVVIHEKSTEQIIQFYPDQSLPEPQEPFKFSISGSSTIPLEESVIHKTHLLGSFTITWKFPPMTFDELTRFLAVFGLKPIRITWIRPRYGLRRPKASAN